jgi:hypothetical protein
MPLEGSRIARSSLPAHNGHVTHSVVVYAIAASLRRLHGFTVGDRPIRIRREEPIEPSAEVHRA